MESHHANWLLKFVPPDVNVCETGIHFHCLIEGHKTFLSNVVACNRQSRRQKWWRKLVSTYKGYSVNLRFNSVVLEVKYTNALSLLCGSLIASLRYTAPSSSMRLEERSRISKEGFCFKTSDKHLAPSRVILLLLKIQKLLFLLWPSYSHIIVISLLMNFTQLLNWTESTLNTIN